MTRDQLAAINTAASNYNVAGSVPVKARIGELGTVKYEILRAVFYKGSQELGPDNVSEAERIEFVLEQPV